MPVRKLSIALDPALADEAARAADEDGLSFSAYLARSLERQLTLRRGLAAVAAHEAEHGPGSDADVAWADALLDRVTPRRAASRTTPAP